MTEPSAATIEVRDVSKWFGGVVALSDVTFSVGTGITALLGPNGAGKSTLLRVLCGLTTPSQGSVRVLGRVPRHDRQLAGSIGLVPQQESLFEQQTALQFVTLAAELHRVREATAAARHALDLVQLDHRDGRRIAAYSKGMRQRVKVAQAVVHDPAVVVLDEPLEGLDPRQRLRMIELFRGLGDEGRTVLVSSHVLDEVEKFGSRVLVLAQGRLAAEGDFHRIRDLMEDRPHRLRLETDKPQALAAGLLSAGTATGAWLQPGGVVIADTVDVGAFRKSIASVARDSGARLSAMVPLDEDLDSVFRYLVERRV